jgi:hypothetical protein
MSVTFRRYTNAMASQCVAWSGDFAENHGLTIRPVASSRELFALYRLTSECYQAKGVSNDHPDGIWASHPDFDHDSDTRVLIAIASGDMVGSISATKDSRKGLTADRYFGPVCASIRAEGRLMGEMWRLVARGPEAQQTHVMLALVDAALNTLACQGVQTCLIALESERVKLLGRLPFVDALESGHARFGEESVIRPGALLRCDLEENRHLVGQAFLGRP